MSVVEVAGALGEWGITLKPNTPMDVLDKLTYFGHVAITAAPVNSEEYGDNLLRNARYVGVNLQRSFGESNKKIGGQGLAYWLADGDGKGYLIEDPLIFPAGTAFNSAVSQLIPPSLTAGTIYNQVGTYSDTIQWKSRRQALDYLCGLFNTEWRVNGDWTVDVGRVDQLYITQPKAAILRGRSGLEMDYRAMPARTQLDSDVKDFTTRVVLLAEGTEQTTVSSTADINSSLNPYKDPKGNPVKLTRIISEQQTSEGNAPARAQLQLNRFTSPRDALKLTTRYYDIRGDVAAGDYVWVYDPEAKLTNAANPIDFQGEYITPIKLRVFQLSWPVEKGMGVSFRDHLGNWIDLTEWVVWESSDIDVVVGGYNRSLTSDTGAVQDPGSRPVANTTIPAMVAWGTYFSGTYTSDEDGMTRAQVSLKWTNPLNTDGSVMNDGDRFEIRRRTGETSVFPVTHADMHLYRHNQLLGEQKSPIPFTLGSWEYFTVGWGINDFLMLDMTPGIPYEFQIRAYDTAVPANVGAWSDLLSITTHVDTTPPADPAPLEVAASKAAIQIVHRLGRSTGGTYNLNADINHLKIYVGKSATFAIDDVSVQAGGTFLGRVSANIGMLKGEIPVVASFQILSTENIWVRCTAVDNDGNESGPSAAVQSKAELWDDAYISNLSVSKVTAGYIQAMWINAGTIATALTGARVVIAWYGIEVFNKQNLKTLEINSQTGDISLVGTVQSGIAGRRVVMSGAKNEILFFPELGETRVGRIFSYIPSNYPNDIAIERRSIDSDQTVYVSRDYLLPDRWAALISPRGEGGDLFSKSSADVYPDFVQLSANQINGTSGSFSETARARIVLAEQGTITYFTNDEAGERTNAFYMDPGLAGWEVRTGQERDGGFVWLGRGNGGSTYFGLHTATRDKYIRFGADDTVVANGNQDFISIQNNKFSIINNGTISHYWDDHGSVHYGVMYSEEYQGIGNNERVALKTDGGGLICFYWAGGQLNIGDHNAGSFIKTFVIDHPTDDARHLVHATTEGPVAGVEYTGEVRVVDGVVDVELPSYFEALTAEEGRTVHLTVIADDDCLGSFPQVKASRIKNGRFKIYSDAWAVSVSWLVKAKRKDVAQFEVEPLKSTGTLRNVGPYTWREEH